MLLADIPIISALGLVILVGMLTLNYFGQFILKLIEGLIGKIPFARSIYSTIKQISEVILSKDGAPYKQVVAIEYPTKEFKSIGFLTNESINLTGEDLVSVFLPTAPNPTSGLLILLKRSQITYLDLTVEQAAKLIISAGAIKPEDIKE